MIVQKKNGERKAGLRVLGIIETIWNALGLFFPEILEEDSPAIFYSVKKLKEESGFLWYKGRRPVIIHPEGTKTNGLGILNIEVDIAKMIIDAASLDQNMRVHAIRFDHAWRYFAAYNTTDKYGFWNFRDCMT